MVRAENSGRLLGFPTHRAQNKWYYPQHHSLMSPSCCWKAGGAFHSLQTKGWHPGVCHAPGVQWGWQLCCCDLGMQSYEAQDPASSHFAWPWGSAPIWQHLARVDRRTEGEAVGQTPHKSPVPLPPLSPEIFPRKICLSVIAGGCAVSLRY